MHLKKRLKVEEQLLRKYFKGFRIQNLEEETDPGVIGVLRSNSGKRYTLWMPLEDFPDAAPPLYVVDPVLYDHDGDALGDYRPSYKMHLLSPDDHGHPRICHYDDDYWHPSVTLYKVVLKSRIWLEAYERHLATGRPIDDFLGHM